MVYSRILLCDENLVHFVNMRAVANAFFQNLHGTYMVMLHASSQFLKVLGKF